MEALKNMPIGIQNFEKLRKGDFLYVDKTALLYQLVHSGSYFFLSRPRRFGKSMLQSTLHAYFDGKKELFKGLAIERLEKDWIKYPVLHLDLNLIKRGDPESLDNLLDSTLRKWEKVYDLPETKNRFGVRFGDVIERAKEVTGKDVVILVDEYDKPILEEIDHPEVQERQREVLKQFYGVLKNLDGYIKFALLTGVTKFSKVSVFSGLNNVFDISMDNRFASICGITDEELDDVFTPYIQRLATVMKHTYDDVREELRIKYDGYHFCEDSVGIYNPFSILCTLQSNKIKNYWFETGTPSYLVYLLKKYHCNIEEMATYECDADLLNCVDSQSKNPIPVIYQSGYLTIKGYNPVYDLYRLGIPNKEVEAGFYKYLLPNYTSIDQSQSGFYIANFVEEIKAGKVDNFLKRLSSLFADTPYELVKDLENHYQNVIFIVSKLMGFYVKAEYHTSEGRIDLVLQTTDTTYVMEFKLNGSAEEALQQINDKNYTLPFEADDRHVIKIGVNFSSSTRNIDRWIIA